MMTVGGIGEKPGVVDGQIAIRDYLSLTISFDHDIIDGAPAARFTKRLKDLIESGYGLEDPTVEPEQTPLYTGGELCLQLYEKATFPDLGKEQYIALTTFRKTGQAVTTPVIFAQSPGTIYVGTRADAGKLKRLRHTARVTLAPCT